MIRKQLQPNWCAAATLLRIPSNKKQAFLAAVSAHELLADLRRHYRREVAFLKMMIEQTLKNRVDERIRVIAV